LAAENGRTLMVGKTDSAAEIGRFDIPGNAPVGMTKMGNYEGVWGY
jgi:hypothetical protein